MKRKHMDLWNSNAYVELTCEISKTQCLSVFVSHTDDVFWILSGELAVLDHPLMNYKLQEGIYADHLLIPCVQ